MSDRKDNRHQTISDQISELQTKIALLDGDRKSYFETSQWSMKKNQDGIRKLRVENKSLHTKFADTMRSDEKVIDVALEGKEDEKAAMRNKSGREAILVMDEKVCNLLKKLNLLKHEREKRENRVQNSEKQHKDLEDEAEKAGSLTSGQAEQAQKKRNLENRLDKSQLKTQEAERLHKTYLNISKQLNNDRLTYQNELDSLEDEIEQLHKELKELQNMNNDAQIARDNAKTDLSKMEETVYRERKERERALAELRKQADEKKAQHDRIERRIQRASLAPEEMSSEQRTTASVEEQEKKISTYEEAFTRIKEATGVSDTQEVVLRFQNQEGTQKHLEDLKAENEKRIEKLREEKEMLQHDFELMKYSGENKLSSGQRMLEEFQTHLTEEEGRMDDNTDKYDRASNILVSAKAGVEHLHDKLKPLKSSQGYAPASKPPPSSDEYVLSLLSVCEDKLLKLMEELDEKDLDAIRREMEEGEFLVPGQLPQHNCRVKLPVTQKDTVYDAEEDESGEDDDVLSRIQIKKQAQQLIDSKTKRKIRTRKKKPQK